jgi:N-acetylgalactosamine-N,N'-diacetylbacillosaminyl-diphospho-undecaprenol 4-alpha-N-acetylgalactosaminyltransferase
MKKKVSIFIYSLASGGAERVVSILLEELQELYDVTLILMNDTIHYSLPKDQKIVYLEKSNPNEASWLKLLKLPYLGFKYQHFCHQNNINTTLSLMNRPNYIALLSKLFGNSSKIIISERAHPSLQHKYGLQGCINQYLIKYLYPNADVIIANSLGNSIDLKNNFNLHAVQTINNPIDLEKIDALAIEPISLSKAHFAFVTIGRLDRGKNHRMIIEAMQEMDAQLWIIGEGTLKSELQYQIKQLGLEHKVFLLGRQENPFKYLSQADAFIFSSNHEGFPNVLVEALACGLPIISTDCPSGPREILAPSSNQNTHLTKRDSIEIAQYGILTPVNDVKNLKKAMRTIMTNENLRNEYKNKSKQRASSFDKKTITKQIINILEGEACAE